MKNFKATLAAILAACSLLGLAGCSENREQSSNLSGSNVDSSDIGQSSDLSNSGDSQSSESNDSSQSFDSGSSDVDSSNDNSQSSDSGSSNVESSNDNSHSSDSSSSNVESSNNSSQSSDVSNSGENTKEGGEVKKTFSGDNTENSIRLFDTITADKENAMFSPLSLNMALGLLEAGTGGETKSQIDSYLQTENYADFAKRYLKHVREDLTKEEREESWVTYQRNVVEIANSFWASDSVPFNESYKQTVSDKFDAEIQNVNFSDKTEALKKINGWVNDKTYEMIPTILKEDDINDQTAAVLINTVYFESPWYSSEWSIDENSKEKFTLSDGTVKELSLMRSYGDKYFENGEATAFSRKYENGTEFIGILPKKSGDFTLEELDIPSLLASGSSRYNVKAFMPRLNFETEFPLKDALIAAGMEDMFNDSMADLSGMSDIPLCVSKVIQKTKLELDEKGTKAAAVTAMNPAVGGGGYDEPPQERTVRLDRPFAFLIYDSAKNQILFMGKVTNP